TDMMGHKWSFGFNFKGNVGGPSSGEFNAVDHASGLHINGPVIGVLDVCASPNRATFQVRDKKTGCIYTVTVEDNGESGGGRDRISIDSTDGGGCPVVHTGYRYLDNGNI